jgi:MoaA/NifB/PqqE/SkfB family radical SAM enzyme
MAAKGIHVDAYFIQSNSGTTAEDLLEGLSELVRMKIRHPYHFHVRFPPVPHLVSYFPGATHRRHVRKGMTQVHSLRGEAKTEGYPEYDYPFVDHDEPMDAWVAAAVDGKFFSGEKCYTDSLERLHAIWTEHYANLADGDEKKRGGALLRKLDDLPRALLFARLAELRKLGRDNPTPALEKQEALTLQLAKLVLGPEENWRVALQRFVAEGVQRLVLIPTWQCELRCRYCFIQKQDSRVMPIQTALEGIDALMSSRREKMILQYFGGEALLEWDVVRETIAYAHGEAQKIGMDLQFVISSNGWSLDRERVEWLAQYPVKLELSLDGDSQTQNRSRPALDKSKDSYAGGIPGKADYIQASGLLYDVIMVVPPEMAPNMAHNFKHIADQGWKRIQINFGLGFQWTKEQKEVFARQLMEVGLFLRDRWAQGDPVSLINLDARPMPVRLNGEITVDWDGSIHSGNAFLLKGRKAGELVLGQLRDNQNFDRFWMDAADNDVLLDSTYSPEVTANNIEVGKIFTSFIKWMQSSGIGPTVAAK